MLLIFFLVTTNMDTDKGLQRQLPPFQKQMQEESFVAKGTMMDLRITASNQLLADGKPMPIQSLRHATATFIRQLGKRHLIKIDVDPQSSYDTYFQVQNELAAAYNQLRNETAHRLYAKDYGKLSAAQRDHVKDKCPQRIAEQYNGTMVQPAGKAEEGGQP